ncbi:MAG: hypothetical protein LBD91_08510 [Prevotellaceae bacterium]|jgi:hypothetical protein|nr:hypothetical protein [Prevotellaceae bacterium]
MELFYNFISLFVGASITFATTFLFFNARKRKEHALAVIEENNAYEKGIDNKNKEFDYYLRRLDVLEKDYEGLRLQKQISDNEYDKKLRGKCTEIAALRSKIVFLSGLRCDRSDCGQRFVSPNADFQ